MRPQTRYADVEGGQVAYQVVGDGPIDLVLAQGFEGSCDQAWDFRPMAWMFERFASFSRLILFDRRGTGASSPVSPDAYGTWELHVDDLLAVLDAAGAERPAILASWDAGPIALMFAAAYPERTRALVLWNSFARNIATDDYPYGYDPAMHEGILSAVAEGWGTEEFASLFVPSLASDAVALRWVAKAMRMSNTPSTAAAQMANMVSLDARSVLPSVHVPTLVMSRDLAVIPATLGRYIADNIAGSRFEQVAGEDYTVWGEGSAENFDLIEEFLTGTRPNRSTNRVLATLLFTDIVDSTPRVSELGDRRWRDLLDRHDRIGRALVEETGGRFIERSGDGLLATFDLPGRAIRCALDLNQTLSQTSLAIRAGLHTGEIELREDGIAGIAVHIGARVMGEAGAGDVVCTRTVKDLSAGSGFRFEDRGTRRLKGVPEDWQLYAVAEAS